MKLAGTWKNYAIALWSIALVVGCNGGSATPTSSAPGGSGAAAGKASEAEIVKVSGLGELSGTIAIDGSSTVFPVTEAVAEEFQNATKQNVKVTVGISGTGGGFK